MRFKIVLAMSMVGFLMSCTAPTQAVYSTHTPDPIQAYVDANASKGTAAAAIATAEYFSNQLTATVEIRNQVATQQAMQLDAQATERTWNATSTANSVAATASASAVAVQATWTQRAVDITSTADIASVQSFATQQYSIARTQELALEREVMVNKMRAVVPWLGLICTFAVLVLVFIRWSRVRVIQRDGRGDAPLLLDVVDGIAYDADRNPTSAGSLLHEDLKKLPQFSASDLTQTTTRDQLVDMATRGLPGLRRRALGQEKSLPAPVSSPQIQVIDSSQAKPLFSDVISHIVQDAIDADVISENTEGSSSG